MSLPTHQQVAYQLAELLPPIARFGVEQHLAAAILADRKRVVEACAWIAAKESGYDGAIIARAIRTLDIGDNPNPSPQTTHPAPEAASS